MSNKPERTHWTIRCFVG